jgi:hypothetical protein
LRVDGLKNFGHDRRPHDAVIRVYDESGKVIEVHRHKGDFKEPFLIAGWQMIRP